VTIFAGIAGSGGSASTFKQHCRQALASQRLYIGDADLDVRAFDSCAIGGCLAALARQSKDTNPDLTLAADVRLDNRAEICAGLGLHRATASLHSDPDLLLAAWSRWGEDSLDQLVGSFAFAVYDRSSGTTFLVRDPFGERPLNYGVRKHRLAFASMPSGVWPAESLRADLEVLAAQYRCRLLPPDQSNFLDIVRVAPGHLVRFSGGSPIVRRYWAPVPAPLPKSHDDLVDAFRATFDVAVDARLSGRSAPNSSMLSSGFDSSSVTGTAARLLDRPDLLTAYTSGPAFDQHLLPISRFADETEIAANSAQMLGIRHRIIRDRTPILDSIRGVSRYFQAPAPNPVNFAWWRRILDDVRSSGQSSLLVAVEGNFTVSFGGTMVLTAYLRQGRLLRWLRETRDTVRTHRFMRLRGALFASFEGLLPLAAVQAAQKLFDRSPNAPEYDFIHPAFDDPDPPPAVRMTGDLRKDRLTLLSLHDNGERYKGMTALTAVEERDPTIDRRFVELCLSLRPEDLMYRGEPRPLAREALSDRMNPQVFNFSRRGIQSADWYDRLSRSDAADMLYELKGTAAAELLDIPKIQDAIDHWPTFDAAADHRLTPFGRGIWWAFSMGLFLAELEEDRAALSAAETSLSPTLSSGGNRKIL